MRPGERAAGILLIFEDIDFDITLLPLHMNKLFAASGTIAVTVALLSWITRPVPTTGVEQTAVPGMADSLRAARNYASYCAGCHGEKMDAFVDRQWKHGQSHADLVRAVKEGYADEGMPAFAATFTDAEMEELAVYMRQGIDHFNQYAAAANTTPSGNLFTTGAVSVKLDTVVRGMKSVWGMAFLPDGRMLVTDKSGHLYAVANNKKLTEINGLPPILDEGQGGLMDVIIHPDFRKNKLVYLSYSAVKEEGNRKLGTTAIYRAKLEGNMLVNGQVIFEAFPYSRTRHHYGSRMVFGRDGMLYFSVGERGNEKENPQTLENDLGKIHRIRDDGSVPADNPFVTTPGARPTIYSYGHRNPQGLAVHPQTGELWSHEHGPRGGDEVNIVKKGANYGWPVITYGINYNGKIISNKTAAEGMEQPLKYWIPSIAPSGMAFVQGKRYKSWEGQLLTGSLRFKYLNLSHIEGAQVTGEEMLLKNIGRLRDVRMGPDGYLYVAVENPGYVFRLVPVKNPS